MTRKFLFTLAVLAFGASAARAGDPSPQPSLCEVDSPACRNLAIGVAKLELSESVHRVIDRHRGGSLLCPEDNPNCCPPRLMPVCAEIEQRVVVAARAVFHRSLVSQHMDNLCESKLDCRFLTQQKDHFDFDPLPWSGDLSPRECPCGWVFNPLRNKCEREICTARGFAIPCGYACAFDNLVVALEDREPPPPSSPLERHLRDRGVQLEAAKLLRDELRHALGAVEKEVAELSSYADKD